MTLDKLAITSILVRDNFVPVAKRVGVNWMANSESR